MAKKIIEVDEDMLRDAMMEIPAMRYRRPAGAVELLPETAPEEPHEPVKRPPTVKKKRREDGQPYIERFLVNDDRPARVTTAINRETHKKMKKMLTMLAPEISIVAYINNVLDHHMEQFDGEINGLYRQETEKPL